MRGVAQVRAITKVTFSLLTALVIWVSTLAIYTFDVHPVISDLAPRYWFNVRHIVFRTQINDYNKETKKRKQNKKPSLK